MTDEKKQHDEKPRQPEEAEKKVHLGDLGGDRVGEVGGGFAGPQTYIKNKDFTVENTTTTPDDPGCCVIDKIKEKILD